uniref:Uncharacterized protein n=1 Tax=Cacopsylla melanoneura TaxID=428564 RepID=A0A8D9EAK3_9HEMI
MRFTVFPSGKTDGFSSQINRLVCTQLNSLRGSKGFSKEFNNNKEILFFYQLKTNTAPQCFILGLGTISRSNKTFRGKLRTVFSGLTNVYLTFPGQSDFSGPSDFSSQSNFAG